MSTLAYLIILLSILNVCFCQTETVTISIPQGELRGTANSTVNGLKYYSFQGIPFAKPPVGDFRFKGPQPAEPWEGTLDAFELGAMCPQLDQYTFQYVGDEDCLFINVYTNLIPTNDIQTLKPVMVYIYGGGFFIGSVDQMTGADFILEQDIIVVTLNYRVGPLGFLSTGDSVIPGNNGLKDQVMALQWIQENIATFGGDPNRVTIFGISAGGCSVHHLVLSPLSAGLFQNAIAQSGSAIDQWGWESPEVARRRALSLTRLLSSPANDSTEIAEFLNSLSSRDITTAGVQLMSSSNALPVVYFRPVIEQRVEGGEEVFLEELPIDIIRAGKFYQVPFMSGTVSTEGALLLMVGIAINPTELGILASNPNLLVPEDLVPYLSVAEIQALAQEIRNYYFGEGAITMPDLVHFIDLVTDAGILYGLNRHVGLHGAVSTKPVYQYQLSFDGRFGSYKSIVGDIFPGVAHGDDSGYLFYNRILDYSQETAEVITSKRMVKLWTNFAKTGNPTPEVDPLLQNITLPPVTSIDRFYLDIGNDLQVKRNLRNDRMAFWEDIYVRISG